MDQKYKKNKQLATGVAATFILELTFDCFFSFFFFFFSPFFSISCSFFQSWLVTEQSRAEQDNLVCGCCQFLYITQLCCYIFNPLLKDVKDQIFVCMCVCVCVSHFWDGNECTVPLKGSFLFIYVFLIFRLQVDVLSFLQRKGW